MPAQGERKPRDRADCEQRGPRGQQDARHQLLRRGSGGPAGRPVDVPDRQDHRRQHRGGDPWYGCVGRGDLHECHVGRPCQRHADSRRADAVEPLHPERQRAQVGQQRGKGDGQGHEAGADPRHRCVHQEIRRHHSDQPGNDGVLRIAATRARPSTGKCVGAAHDQCRPRDRPGQQGQWVHAPVRRDLHQVRRQPQQGADRQQAGHRNQPGAPVVRGPGRRVGRIVGHVVRLSLRHGRRFNPGGGRSAGTGPPTPRSASARPR